MSTPIKILAAILVATSAEVGSSQAPAPHGFAEEMRIVSDEMTPAMQLTRPEDLIVNAKGLLFTSHRSEGMIRVFDASGKYLRSIGRTGQGPGESRNGWSFLAAVGDTVIVLSANAVTFFRDDGTLIRSTTIERFPSGREQAVMSSYLGGDRAFAYAFYYTRGRGAPVADSTVYWIVDTTGRPIQRVGAAGANHTSPSKPGAPESYFRPRTHALSDPAGRGGFMIQPPDAWGGNPGQVRLVRIGREGKESERILSLEIPRLTPRDVDEHVARHLSNIAGMDQALARLGGRPPSRGGLEQEVRAHLTRQQDLPPIDYAIAGADGSLWIRSFASRGDWTALAPSGTFAYKVRIPDSLHIHRVSLDRFWAVSEDSNGLPIITRNRVVPH